MLDSKLADLVEIWRKRSKDLSTNGDPGLIASQATDKCIDELAGVLLSDFPVTIPAGTVIEKPGRNEIL